MRNFEISQVLWQNCSVQEEFKTPGQLIESLLLDRGWSQRVLAAVLSMSESTLNKLISGKQAVTAEIAIVLEEVFAVDAARFLALQQTYDLARARIVSRPNPTRAMRAQIFAELPISELIQRRWINVENVRDMDAIDEALIQFFEGQNPTQISATPHAARKTSAGEQPSAAQLAWIYRVRQIAKELLVPKYNEAAAKAAIPKLKALLSAPEEARHAPRILQECGIRLVLVEGLKSSKIDGVCLWLNEQAPVIGMTMRFDRMDNFWFVLRHELEHVLQGHGKDAPLLDVEMNGEAINEEEKIANAAAADFCAPKARIDSFIQRKAPIFPERDFLGLAKVLGVHPALVAGQIQFKTGRYELFRTHLVKIRNRVLPSAIVDGWGDVAPVGIT
ncbi:HigA family addiction module antitoxin [Comamonas thiooxydans]|uniref:HigA family addiction module antitoxin n=1 Tax=Comamonas thiooxydans TaxID=363952 RepID=UPI00244D24F4|nr:HigA family addiction module antitoxin [Comamonas thiooxydans]MDH1475808.1 HigA family addiction module antitoxin [Comamonas thiooxydans]